MIERPILFSGPMVRAILDGQKTQTRRVVKPQPPEFVRHSVAPQELRGEPKKHTSPYFDAYNGGPHWCWWDEYDRQGDGWIKCPYGKPGDRLWVREACKAEERASDGSDGVRYIADDAWLKIENSAEAASRWVDLFHYGQTGGSRPDGLVGKGVPSIHMPRWASRILLEIVSIRVERLNDCSREDALAEGVREPSLGEWVDCDFGQVPRALCAPRLAYAALWDLINGTGAWSANPWVWVVEFKRAQP